MGPCSLAQSVECPGCSLDVERSAVCFPPKGRWFSLSTGFRCSWSHTAWIHWGSSPKDDHWPLSSAKNELIDHDIIYVINVKNSESNTFQCCCSFDNVYRTRENGGFIILTLKSLISALKVMDNFSRDHTLPRKKKKTGHESMYVNASIYACMKIVVVLY
jgi:hypothetical protein